VDELAQIPLAYPTHAAVLVRAAVGVADQLNLKVGWREHEAA
jgi:dihydrolipoamide dehydrogenase